MEGQSHRQGRRRPIKFKTVIPAVGQTVAYIPKRVSLLLHCFRYNVEWRWPAGAAEQVITMDRARVAKPADAKDLKSFARQRECGFDSHPGHQYKPICFNQLTTPNSPCTSGVPFVS